MYLTAPQRKSALFPVCSALTHQISLYSFELLFPTPELPWYYLEMESVWPLQIHICVRIALQYLRSCLNIHPTSFIQVEFLRFHQGLCVAGHAVSIFLAAQDYIAEVVDSTGTYFGLKRLSLLKLLRVYVLQFLLFLVFVGFSKQRKQSWENALKIPLLRMCPRSEVQFLLSCIVAVLSKTFKQR